MDAEPGATTGMSTRPLDACMEGSWPPQMTTASAPSSSLLTALSRMPGAASSISARDSTEGGAFRVCTNLTSVPGEA